MLELINQIVWGPALIILIIAVGLLLTIRLRGIQFSQLWVAHKLAFTKQTGSSTGDISNFQALMTALAGTIGIGTIAGVATAVATGGLGALFWMWVFVPIGMAIKYAEALLAIKYRVRDAEGKMCGGPMYYLERGLNNKYLAIAFALFAAIAAIGTGNMVQSNSVAAAAKMLIPSLSPVWVGVALMLGTAIPLFGGIKRISKVSSIVIPAMAIFYLAACFLVLGLYIEEIPATLVKIVRAAFQGQAAVGGFLGAGIMAAIQCGFSRGIFSSEAGLGTSSIAAAAAKTQSPVHQALVSMSTVFITTGIVCTLTGLVLAVTDVLGVNATGSALAIHAFQTALPFGGMLVAIAIIPFAYTTILGWAYYGEKSVEYLLGHKAIAWYRWVYSGAVFWGAILQLETVWSFANIMNGLMALPNLIGLLFLGGVVVRETEAYLRVHSTRRVPVKGSPLSSGQGEPALEQ